MPILNLNSVILTSIGLIIMMVLVMLVMAAHQHRKLIHRWILGLALIGSGMAAYFVPNAYALRSHDGFFVINAFSAICLGISLYVNGIRMLKGYRVYRYLPLLVLTILLSSNAILINLQSPLRWLLVSNLFMMMCLFAYGCKSLFGRGHDFVNNVFWLCSSLFASATIMLLGLVFEVALIDANNLLNFYHWNSHAYMIFLIMLVLCAVSVLLVLILQVRAQNALQAIATLDGLTGVLNRRGLQEAAFKMQAVSQRIQLPMALLVVDLDYFKKVNDVYGHLVGDAVLRGCANTIRLALRGGDIIGRYGGEEFCLLLPNTGEVDAAILAERIRKTIESTPVNVSDVESLLSRTHAIKSTVSIGAVSSDTVGYVIDRLFAAADHNLYQAKQNGRNQIVSNVDRLPKEMDSKSAKRRKQIISSQ